jgi:hypothetical protein
MGKQRMMTRFRSEADSSLYWVVGPSEEWLSLPEWAKRELGGPDESGMTDLKGFNGQPVCYDCGADLVYNHHLGWRLRPAGVGRCGRCRGGVGG